MNYLKKPAVQIILFLLVVGGAVTAFLLSQQKGAPAEASPKPIQANTGLAKPGVGSTNTKEAAQAAGGGTSRTFAQSTSSRLVLPEQKPPQVNLAQPAATKDKGNAKPPPLPKLVHFSKPLTPENFVPKVPKVFAPRGLLIKAALVITVDSSSLNTPVLAMVTEDCYYRGKLMVPAGVQVHAEAGGGRVRDRLEISGAFTFVWADGREYMINGVALDHSRDGDGTFSITDGSAGIRGMILKTEQYAEMKLLLAEAISAMAQNSQERVQSIYGMVPTNSSNNASLAGASGAAGGYANLLSKKIERDLEYVRVAAGTQFYIFTKEMFEPELASIGGVTQGGAAKGSMQLQKEAYAADQAAAASGTTSFEQGSLEEGDTAGRLKLQRESQNQAARLGSYLSSKEAAVIANDNVVPAPTTPAN